jgi:hypothetical protein
MEKYSTARQTTDDNMAHAHCMVDIQSYKRTLQQLRMRIAWWIPKATNTHCNNGACALQCVFVALGIHHAMRMRHCCSNHH